MDDTGFFGGLFQGLAGGLGKERDRVAEENARREEHETQILHALATNPDIDPSISEKALAGLLQLSSGRGRRKSKGIQGWLGAMEGTPELQDIQNSLAAARNAPSTMAEQEPGQPPHGTPAPGAPPPTMTQGAGMPTGSFATGNAQPQMAPAAPEAPGNPLKMALGTMEAPPTAAPAMAGMPPGAPTGAPQVPMGAVAGLAPDQRHPLETQFANRWNGGRDRSGQPINLQTPYEAIEPPPVSSGTSLAPIRNSVRYKAWEQRKARYDYDAKQVLDTLSDPAKADLAAGRAAHAARRAGQVLTPEQNDLADAYAYHALGEELPKTKATRIASESFQAGLAEQRHVWDMEREDKRYANQQALERERQRGAHQEVLDQRADLARERELDNVAKWHSEQKVKLNSDVIISHNPATLKKLEGILEEEYQARVERINQSFAQDKMLNGVKTPKVGRPVSFGKGFTIEELPAEK